MNVLMIGMGMVAQTHLLALRDNAVGLRLGSVLGRDKDRVAAFCDAAEGVLGYPVSGFTELSEALATNPAMAIVLTPPNARLDYANALAVAGIPTLLEKPVERTLQAARTVVETFESANVPLGLCFQHRTRAAAAELKQRLGRCDMGDVVHLEMRVPWWRDQAYYDAPGRGSYDRDGGGVMINQAIHTLDLALWLVGPVMRVQAMMRTSPLHQMEAEDIAAALMEFGSGATGVLSAATATYPGETESISITTTQAQIALQGDHLTIHWHDGRTEIMAPDDTGGTGGSADPMAFTHAWHQAVIEDFAQSVQTGGSPLATGREAVHVHAVIHAMEKAARSGTITEVPQ